MNLDGNTFIRYRSLYVHLLYNIYECNIYGQIYVFAYLD